MGSLLKCLLVIAMVLAAARVQSKSQSGFVKISYEVDTVDTASPRFDPPLAL